MKNATLALLIVFGWLIGAGNAHADPGMPDICGTGKFYNTYDNQCLPTDRGAYPNTPPYNPSYGPGPRF
jgi:hypothetical protein